MLVEVGDRHVSAVEVVEGCPDPIPPPHAQPLSGLASTGYTSGSPAGRGTGDEERSMKITHVTTRILSTPADNPLVVGLPRTSDTREFVTLELGTDQGLVGVGLTFFGGALTPALKVAVDALAELRRSARIRRRSKRSRPSCGARPAARARAASSRWRCRRSTWRAGTSRARPRASRSARCWAACATASPTYASGALMRQHPVDYLAKAGPRLVRHGLSPDEDAVRQRADGRRRRSSACASCASRSAPTST